MEIGDIAFHLGCHHAYQCNMTVLHDGMQRRNGLERVAGQHGMQVDGLIDGETQPVVGWRRTQSFEVMVAPFRVFECRLGTKLSSPAGFVLSVSHGGMWPAKETACN